MHVLNIVHKYLTDCLTLTGIIYQEMKNYHKGFEYFEEASKNEEKNPSYPNLIQLARNYDNMDICLSYQNDHSTGLKYRMKAVKTIDAVSPCVQYAN
ncbi:unnamed protein product [Rotaria sp. Silwood1]|nr:unnamed protein product [Rotaria sp. Silwood1]